MNSLLLSILFLVGQPLADPTYFSYNSPACVAAKALHGNLLPLMVATSEPSCPWTAEEASSVETGRYVTHYSFWNEDRTNNLELSASKLDGLMLLPGQELSFNQIVGERTEERGFKKANVIVGAKGYELGLGGGICQTASTVHAAALFAGLDVLERHPHRFRVKYMPAGLDATVNYGKKDLRIANNTPFPVVFHLGFVNRGDLIVRVMSPAKVYAVRYKYEVLEEVLSDTVRFEIAGKVKDRVHYYGRPGYKIEKFVYKRNLWTGDKQRVTFPKDDYKPSPWVLRVAELPGGRVAHSGLTKAQIAEFLQGSRYTVDMARFPDLKPNLKDWVSPPNLRDADLEKLIRFKQTISGGSFRPEGEDVAFMELGIYSWM